MSHTPELAELRAEYEVLKAKSPELTSMLEKAFAAGSRTRPGRPHRPARRVPIAGTTSAHRVASAGMCRVLAGVGKRQQLDHSWTRPAKLLHRPRRGTS